MKRAMFFLLLPCVVVLVQAADFKLDSAKGGKLRNIIFILTDDHRFDAMGFMGHPFLETPHLDAMAKGGAHFANAFVTTSLCSPGEHSHRQVRAQSWGGG